MSSHQSVLFVLDPATSVAVPLSALVDPVSGFPYLRASMYGLAPTSEQVEFVSARQGTFAAQSPNGAMLVAHPGEWSVSHEPAAGAVATVTMPAVPGSRHVCRALAACMTADGAPATAALFVRLLDGASGVGTILWSGVLRGGANSNGVIALSGLNIVGSVNTDMTLEFSAAPDAGHNQTVSLTGYTAS